jgi:hemoglobin
MASKTDLATRADVERLVNIFYDAVRGDDILAPIFDDVARVDWNAHLPKMYDFWETVLFGKAAFRGNPLAVHLGLSKQVRLSEREFSRWLALFNTTVDALFEGPGAVEAKTRAERIAAVMQHHISASDDPRLTVRGR